MNRALIIFGLSLLAGYAQAAFSQHHPLTISSGKGPYNSCALDDEGIQCWGGYGGGPDRDDYLINSNIPDMINPTTISLGARHACAIDQEGLKCWGQENWPLLRNQPVINAPNEIVLGNLIACATSESDGLTCWGDDRSNVVKLAPGYLPGAKSLDIGIDSACAISRTTVTCWGGDDFSSNMPSLDNPTDLAVGRRHVCALDNGGVKCWSSSLSNANTEVPILSNPTAISASFNNTCALDDTGVVCWGEGPTSNNKINTPPVLENITSLNGYGNHFCALSDKGVSCWGSTNYNGELSVPELMFDSDHDGFTNQYGIDAFPNDASEHMDSDLDGVGDNADAAPLDDAIKFLSSVELYDVNGDGIKELGQFGVRLRDNKPQLTIFDPFKMTELSTITWPKLLHKGQFILLGDHNGDQVRDVGYFGLNSEDQRPQLFVKDGANGSSIGTWSWPANWNQVKFVELDDTTGDGIKEFAITGFDRRSGRANLIPKDGTDSSVVLPALIWPNLWKNVELFKVGDLNGDGIGEFALYGQRIKNERNQVFIKDFTDITTKTVYNWPDNWDDVGAGLAKDMNADGVDDIALMGIRKDDARPQVVIKDGSNNKSVVAAFGWPSFLVPDQFMNVSDRDGDGQEDIALLGTRNDDGRRQVVIKSSLTGESIDTFGWNTNWKATSIIELHDMTGDGKNDFALLGTNVSSGSTQLVVVNSETGNALKPYTWPEANTGSSTLVWLEDLNGDDVPEIGLFFVSEGEGVMKIKDGASGSNYLAIPWTQDWY